MISLLGFTSHMFCCVQHHVSRIHIRVSRIHIRHVSTYIHHICFAVFNITYVDSVFTHVMGGWVGGCGCGGCGPTNVDPTPTNTESTYTYKEKRIHMQYTGWRRHIGCLKLQVIFRKRATNYRALLQKTNPHAVYRVAETHRMPQVAGHFSQKSH